MRFKRSSKFFVVYIKVDKMRWPVMVPIPLAAVEELLQGLAIVMWLAQGLVQGWLNRRRQARFAARAVTAACTAEAADSTCTAATAAVDTSADVIGNFLSRVALWRLAVAGRRMVQAIRKQGSFDIINVETEDAKVRIGLL